MSEPAVQVRDLSMSYRMGKVRLQVLRDLSLRVPVGKMISIVGASGSGKSTLLHLMGLLDRPDSGEVFLDGQRSDNLPARKRNAVRCRQVGFVFQFYHLLPELNVLENALLPAMVDASVLGWLHSRRTRRRQCFEVLDRLGLSARLKHRPRELSGGERQRVAIARALVNRPRLLLADEPTGNLDSHTGAQILDVLTAFNREQGQTLILVTHDPTVASRADRVVHLRDGKLVDA